MTAKVSCFARAYHFENNKTHIFADSMAKMILGDDFNQIAESMIQGISFLFRDLKERKKGSGLLSISSYLHQCLEEAHIVRESLWMRFQQGVTSILSLLRAMNRKERL
jgi:hypothetical protein